MAEFHNLSLDQKIKAFKQAKDITNITEGQLILITEDYYDAGLTFARDSFLRDEPMNNSMNAQWSKETEDFWLDTFRNNLTVAIVDDVSGEVIAIRGIRVLNKDDVHDISNIKDPSDKEIWGLVEHCNNKANFFERFQVKQAFELFGFSVHHQFRNRGIAGKLFKAALDMLRFLVPERFCVKGETSSEYSRRIYEKNNFEKLYEMSFSEYVVDDQQVICNTGDHQYFTVWGIQIHPTHA